jgi:outer membrane protein assembly factor BamB
VNSIWCDASPTPDVVWSTALGEPPAGPLVVAGDLLVTATQEPDLTSENSTLHALGLADGSLHWQRLFEYALVSGLAVTADGRILAAITSTNLIRGEGALVALGDAGEECCRWSSEVQRVSAPAWAGDVVCVIADARRLIILDSTTCKEQARVALDAIGSLSAPALVDGVVYVPGRGSYLLAVGLDGYPRWRFDAEDASGAWLDRTPVVVEEHLFAVLSTGAVLALRVRDGLLTWQVNVGPPGKPLSTPATDGERLFVGARDGLHALALADGRLLWDFPTPRRITATPVVTGGVVYAACHDHHLYALDGATGQELWRYEVGRRIEVPPVLATCGEPPRSCVLITDRGCALTAIARTLSAEEHEAAGHWVEAVSAYAALGQLAHGAQLLETHGKPLEAGELWEAAGEREHAALQYEAAGAWQQAAELWAALSRPLKQAEALKEHARSLEDATCSAEERAEIWGAAARLFESEGEAEHAAACWREVAQWLRQPVITMDVQHDGLVLDAWSCLQFIVRNDGYGPAHNLVIHASGDEFEGQVTATRQIATLRAGRERTDWLDVRPREYGDSVPLRVSVEYEVHAGELRSCERTIYIAVARSEATRREGKAIPVLVSGGGAGEWRERELASLRRQLEEARENLLLIRERESQYVMETNIPLDLIKRERRLQWQITDLEARLAQLECSAVSADAPAGKGELQDRATVDEIAADRTMYELEYNAKVAAPRSVEIYKRFELEAQLLYSLQPLPEGIGIQAPKATGITIDFPKDARTGKLLSAILEFRLMAPGFKVYGKPYKTVEVFPKRDSPRCVFHLEAQRSGLEPISVEVRQRNRLLGTVVLNVEVKKAKVAEIVLQVLEVSMSLLFTAISGGGDFVGRDAATSADSGAVPCPSLPGTTHVLSFDRLSPADFERLCLWLVGCEGYTRGKHLGLAGSEQGRDVVAYKSTPHGEELWYFQCKRYRSINAKVLKYEVDKHLQLAQEKPHLRPAGVVFVVSCAVSARVREEVGAYCEQHGLAHEFWALTELNMRVKRHPDLLREFFNLAP